MQPCCQHGPVEGQARGLGIGHYVALLWSQAWTPSNLRTWAVQPFCPHDLWVGQPQDWLSSHVVLPQPLL